MKNVLNIYKKMTRKEMNLFEGIKIFSNEIEKTDFIHRFTKDTNTYLKL